LIVVKCSYSNTSTTASALVYIIGQHY